MHPHFTVSQAVCFSGCSYPQSFAQTTEDSTFTICRYHISYIYNYYIKMATLYELLRMDEQACQSYNELQCLELIF